MQQDHSGFALKDIPAIVKRIESFCTTAEQQVPVLDTLWDGWRKGLEEIQEKTSQAAPCSRVAVIGSIKSGKSTFVNALLQSDILRRGAGTLTSAVTRVMPAETPKASITWKGWRKVNKEVSFIAALLAGMSGAGEPLAELDLREEAHREIILNILDNIGPSPVGLPRYAQNQFATLRAMLNGYDRIHLHLQEESTALVLEREWFLEHRDIVTSDDTAAYVEDVQVDFPYPEVLPQTEIADCQGSDSLNPSHLARVQEYLLQTDWAIYVVDSVMGLREADEKLLEVVKGLGLKDNIVFILNVEVDAHASLDDLRRVQDSVEKWIAAHFGIPRLYTVCVLMELFHGLEKKGVLTERETNRLLSWKEDREMLEVLQGRWQDLLSFWRDEISPAAGRFQRAFAHRSLANLIGRLRHSIRIASNPYDLDLPSLEIYAVEAEKLLPNMEAHLDGTALKAERMVRNKIDSLLDPSFSELGKEVKGFIDGYSSEWDPASAGAGGQASINGMILYLAEEFNQALQLFLTDNVNAEVTRQAHQIVGAVQLDYSTVVDMYLVVLKNNYLRLCQSHQTVSSKKNFPGSSELTVSRHGAESGDSPVGGMDVREILASPHIDLFSLKLELSLGQKVLAAVHQGWMLSFRKARSWVSHRVLKKELEDDDVISVEVRTHWRDKTVKRLKREGKLLMKQEMVRYRENLKYQILIKYVQELARSCKEELKKRLEEFQEDVDRAQKAPGLSDRDVTAAREFLPEWETELREIESLIRL